MKKILVWLLCVAMVLSLCACGGKKDEAASETTAVLDGVVYEYSEADPTRVVSTITYESGIEVSRDNYQYTESGNIKTVQTVKNGEITQTTSYKYDGNKMTHSITEFVDEGIACKEISEIDENDRVTSKTYYEDGEKSGKVLYSYDEDGNMVREDTVDDDGNVLAHKINTYDGFGKLVRVDCYEFGSLAISYVHTYKDGVISETKKYDGKGNLIE